ncbi:hypothetical protein BDZ91DRAFT_126801 [Kalaharituber pfeilii]|nr:hypothetical protein BDZ91DRAFT_126801 [Kalaharituber pfeilii]
MDTSRDPFERLDLNVVAMVVELLNPVDIVRLQRVSQSWHDILGSEYISRIALLAHFPNSTEAKQLVEKNARGKEIPTEPPTEPIEKEQRKKRRKKNKTVESTLPEAVVGFRRATFRLHTRALAKPSKVHKHRLHHVSEKSFAATSTHLFWAESSRNIWVQTIGEGVGGRRALKLKTFGDTIAHLYQITATEGGLVIVLFREVVTWSLVLMAIEHQTDRVVWKINPPAVPIGLQVTNKHIYYTIGVSAIHHANSLSPHTGNTHIYIHSLETGKMMHSASLQIPDVGDCSVVPGAHLIYPPSKPTKIFATYNVQTHGEACRSVVRVYSIDGTFLHRFDLDRPTIDASRYRPDLSLRFTIIPASRSGEPEKIMLLESTSRPHSYRTSSMYVPWTNMDKSSSMLSAWIINPITHELEEIRRYFSTYAENEKIPIYDGFRDEVLLGLEHTRLECLDAVRGISYIYYDENKKKEPIMSGDEDQSFIGVQPVRAWYENGGARIDSICYEERYSRAIGAGLPIKQERSDTLISTPPPFESFLYRPQCISHANAATQTPADWRIPGQYASTYPSPLGSPSQSGSSDTKPQVTLTPVIRHFYQTSRHKLVQPEIMRRRRRRNLGEDEEDWQLLPVKTGPMIFMDVKGGEASNDGRFVFLLAKCSGWSITCFVLDFQPEW